MTTAPGSPEAIAAGCTCSPIDNNDGRGGRYDGMLCYWVRDDCPIHGNNAGGVLLPRNSPLLEPRKENTR